MKRAMADDDDPKMIKGEWKKYRKNQLDDLYTASQSNVKELCVKINTIKNWWRLTMKLLRWNSCGLKNPQRINALKDLTKQEDPDILFIQETKSSAKHVNSLKYLLGFERGLGVDS